MARLPTAQAESLRRELVEATNDWANPLGLEAHKDADGREVRAYGRPKQLPPPGDWFLWTIRSGRGFGKTRTGAEWVKAEVAAGRARQVGLVERTPADARDTMIEGPAGILSRYKRESWNAPNYEPAKKRLTWPNGAVATIYTAAEPNATRGANLDLAWCEEAASWKAPECWSNIKFGTRIGEHPRILVTTTPQPTKLMRQIIAESDVVVSGSSHENRANLSDVWFAQVIEPVMGTRLGRQEVEGELLEEAEGALWTRGLLEATRWTDPLPQLDRVVVGVDPSGGAAEIGIVAGGVATVAGELHGFILRDSTLRASPERWARAVIQTHDSLEGDRIVAEANFGGEMVESTLRAVDRTAPVRMVHASRGKRQRAEPVAALFEKGRCHLVGPFPELEDELCTWEPDVGLPSPNRLDAMVWAVTDLMLKRKGASIRDLYPDQFAEASA